MDRSEKKSISGMQLQQTSKTGNDIGYILPMAVELGKASLPLICVVIVSRKVELRSVPH